MTRDQLKIVWDAWKDEIGYQSKLFTLGFTHDQLDVMDEWDSEVNDVISEIKKEWYGSDYQTLLKKELNTFKNDQDSEWVIETRLRYLAEQIKQVEQQIMAIEVGWENLLNTMTRRERVINYGDIYSLKDIKKKLARYRFEFDMKKNGVDINSSQITEEIITKAREFPFTELAQFNNRGFMQCPYHNEKSASFSLNKKNNYAHCFGCDKSVDTIQYVMDQHKKTFVDAVKFLAGI